MDNNQLIQWVLLEEADNDDVYLQYLVNPKPKLGPTHYLKPGEMKGIIRY